MKKIFIGLVVVIVIVLILIVTFGKSEDNNRTVSDNAEEVTSMYDFVISPQKEVSIIKIDKLILEKPGFVVIHEVINDKPGQVLEVSKYLTIGTHQNIEIPLEKSRQSKQIDIGSGFPITNELVALVYADDGDQGFNPSLDSILETETGILARYVESGDITSRSVIVPGSKENIGSVSITVIYTDDGFSPNTIEVNQGETVEFINKSRRPMWVASNSHPAHDILSTFDQFTVSGFGESWQYTFDQKGTWKYHDHVNASMEGVVIVK